MAKHNKHIVVFNDNVIRLKAYLVYLRDKNDDAIHNWYKALEELNTEYRLHLS